MRHPGGGMLAELWDAADGDARRSAVGAQWLAFTLAKLGKKFGRINVRKGGNGRLSGADTRRLFSSGSSHLPKLAYVVGFLGSRRSRSHFERR